MLLLSRVKRHIQEELRRLPDISCLETVQRQIQSSRGKLQPLDTIRLEVHTNGVRELYSSPGDRKFSERHPISYAGSGTLGNGIFGLYLKDILLGGFAAIAYQGEEPIRGRPLARYDYRLPVPWSGQTIRMPEGSGTVGLRGSFWADPQSYDVIRLDVNADSIPATLPLTEAVTSIDYARTDLGSGLVVLLPASAEFRLVKLSGEVSHNRMQFDQCHVFGAQSTIAFGAPDVTEETPRFGVAAVDDTLRPLPGRLRIAVSLRTRISSDMAVGTLIAGVVADNVPAKGPVVVAAGSPVRGLIRRMDHFTDPIPYFVVGLEFTEVEVQGIRRRFHAEVTEIQGVRGVQRTLSISGQGDDFMQRSETISFSNLPGVATFFFVGSRLDLPKGFRTVWKTRSWRRHSCLP